MILVQSLAAAQAQRRSFVLPNGHQIWVSPVFPASAETLERPMASLVEQPAHTTIPSHFHTVNQFQVVLEGQGSLGKRAVQPWVVHYTNGYTGYGPLCAGAQGMAFVTLRNRFDAGARYFPAGQSFMKPAPKRHHLAGPLALRSAADLHALPQPTCEPVLEPEDDGLAAWCLRLGPHMRLESPDPAQGAGQYLLIAGGTLVHDGAALPPLTCLYVSADTAPLTLQSGAEGLEILLLQFPVAEAYQPYTGKRSESGGQAQTGASHSNTARAGRSGGRGKPAQADPEHVVLAQQGAEAIAAWREAHPGERLHLAQAALAGANLRGANLQGARLFEAVLDGADLVGANLQQADMRAASLVEADLTGADLQQASLVRANLTRARLPGARLQRAHLHGAHLPEADLREAHLQRAYLISTELVGADLRGAALTQADLQWANLEGAHLLEARLQEANLRESVLGATIFGHTHLGGTQGLETCRHQGPSSLDVDTLVCSGPLPEVFLRGCGWSATRLSSLQRSDADSAPSSAGCPAPRHPVP